MLKARYKKLRVLIKQNLNNAIEIIKLNIHKNKKPILFIQQNKEFHKIY